LYCLNRSPRLVSFIIPTVDKTDLLEQCLDSIINVCMLNNASGIKHEILVVQDGISPGITNKLKALCKRFHCHFLQTGRFSGYTSAINLGLQYSKGDLLVLLNDDVRFEQKEWLDLIIKSLQLHPQAGLAGCRLLYPDRRIQYGGMFYSDDFQLLRHKFQGCPESEPDAQRVIRTVALTGAVLAVKREVYSQIGPLDQRFVILCSDTDYCLTAHMKGWYVLYNGKAYAIHMESQTRKQFAELKQLSKIEYRDKLLFYNKWSGQLKQMHMRGMI
jgi:GT2 family glycosyltransferase